MPRVAEYTDGVEPQLVALDRKVETVDVAAATLYSGRDIHLGHRAAGDEG